MHFLGEVLLEQPNSAYVVSVALGSDTKDARPALTIGGKVAPYASALLAWPESDRLAALLVDARRRYA